MLHVVESVWSATFAAIFSSTSGVSGALVQHTRRTSRFIRNGTIRFPPRPAKESGLKSKLYFVASPNVDLSPYSQKLLHAVVEGGDRGDGLVAGRAVRARAVRAADSIQRRGARE